MMYVPQLGRRRVSASTRTVARTVAATLIVVALVAFGSNAVRTPVLPAFLPIVVTLWFGAESLTALVLFGQFYLTGSVGFALFAAAYEFAALLAVPYLVYAPGIGSPAAGDAGYQAMGWLWLAWHLAFPALVVAGFTADPLLKRRLGSRRDVGSTLAFVAVATFAVAVALAVVLWCCRSALPALVIGGHHTALFGFVVAPAVAIANAGACAYAYVRGRNATSLGVWIVLATFAAALDGLIDGFAGRTFALGWYLARIETMLTASVVLAMLSIEIALILGRLAELATRDALTGLYNRRGLDEYLGWAYEYARRHELGIALLVIDIDHFKRYNDRYGHAAGDVALRRIAAVLRKAAVRRYDLVARFGGEEFVVALFNVGPFQAVNVASRLQKRVEEAWIPHEGAASGRLSVSIGIGHVADAAHATIPELFEAADRALYRAKEAGRNRYMFASIG
jgi:diguanylate cyclase (GGDEF)-like protein